MYISVDGETCLCYTDCLVGRRGVPHGKMVDREDEHQNASIQSTVTLQLHFMIQSRQASVGECKCTRYAEEHRLLVCSATALTEDTRSGHDHTYMSTVQEITTRVWAIMATRHRDGRARNNVHNADAPDETSTLDDHQV